MGDIASPDLLFQTGPEALQMALVQFSGKVIDFSSIELPFTVKSEDSSRSVKVVSSEEKYATSIFISFTSCMLCSVNVYKQTSFSVCLS